MRYSLALLFVNLAVAVRAKGLAPSEITDESNDVSEVT